MTNPIFKQKKDAWMLVFELDSITTEEFKLLKNVEVDGDERRVYAPIAENKGIADMVSSKMQELGDKYYDKK